MRLKNFLPLMLCLIFVASSISLRAQNQIVITGQVKDGQTKEALEFCTVSVFGVNDSLAAGAITDTKGFFSIPLNPGAYRFVFSFVGYKNDTVPFTTLMQNTFLGVFRLEPDLQLLNTFTVKTSSRDNLIDKDVQVVTDKMKEGTSNTKEVLDKLPGVDYDRYSNAIKVDNDAKVIILVDGLEKDQEYIKNLAPDRLKKIEVIRDPGGRYALEGYAAVINVILKKDYQGVELFLSNETMFDSDAPDKKDILIINNASGTFNYTYNKFNFYTKFGSYYNHFMLPSLSRKVYDYGLTIENNPPSGDINNTRVDQLTNSATLGADFYINPKHTISYEGSFTKQPEGQNTTTVWLDNTYYMNGSPFHNFTSTAQTISSSQSSYNAFFYQGTFNEKNSVNANFTYSDYANDYTGDYSESTLYRRLEKGANNKRNARFYLEYFHTFNPKTNIQVGYGNTWDKQHNTFTVSDVQSTFDYADFRHKLYSYFSWQAFSKIGFKAGCAAETSAPKTTFQNKQYLIFLPYADIKYDPSAALSLKLKYRVSNTYPGMEQTNPFSYTIDQLSIKTGNPALRPEVTHRVSLQTNILGGFASVEPYFHFSKNFITETGMLKNDSIFEYSFSNSGQYKNYGIQSNFTIPFGKTVYLQSTLNYYESRITFNNKTNNVKNFTASEQLLYVKEKTGFVAGLQYQKNLQKFITAQGYNKGDNDFWICFVQQPFLKQKLNLTLIYFLPVKWGADFIQGSYIETENYNESRLNDISFLKNIVMLQASYRFNKGKSVNKKEKKIEQDNEKSTKGKFL